MDRATTGVSVFVALLTAVGVMIVGAGVAFDTTTKTNPDGFYVIGGFCLGAAVWLAFLYFMLWPFLRWAARKRAKVLAKCDAEQGRAHSLSVRSARYGDTDVTEVVASKVLNGRLDFKVTNDELGGDPTPGVVKTLTFTYVLDGKQQTTTFNENAWVEIPPA